VLAAILGFEKRIHEVRPRGAGDWKLVPLGSLGGKTIGIAGFGAIGRAVAERVKPFGVEIKVLRRSSCNTPCRASSRSTASSDLPPLPTVFPLWFRPGPRGPRHR
jgi:phosphoglycerate dehydrogenase-like enzyme